MDNEAAQIEQRWTFCLKALFYPLNIHEHRFFGGARTVLLRTSFDLRAGHVQSKIANPGTYRTPLSPGPSRGGGKINSPRHEGTDLQNIGPGSGDPGRGWAYIDFIVT